MSIYTPDHTSPNAEDHDDRNAFRSPNTAIILLSYLAGCAIASFLFDDFSSSVWSAVTSFFGIAIGGALLGVFILVIVNAICIEHGDEMPLWKKILFALAVPALVMIAATCM